jgi:hypothetical protein
VDSSGVLRSAVTNLLLRSEEFNDAAWPRFGATLPTVTANAGVAPNGTTTADLWTRSITGPNFISQAIAKAASTIQYTFSVFVKQSVGNFCALRCQGIFPNKVDVVFNISSGTISTPATVAGGTFTGPSASITPYPDGWYRLTVTATSETHTGYQCLASFNSNGGVIDGIDTVSNSAGFLWGAQLEQASTVGDYVPTTSAINSAPRFDHRITSSTTNLLLRSEEFDNASWDLAAGTRSANATTAPSGSLTADKLIAATTPGTTGQLFQGVTITSGATITGSVFVKDGGFDRFEIVLLSNNNTTPYGRATFNPITGTITTAASTANGGTNASASVVAYGNGWYRLILTVTYPAVTAAGMRIFSINSDSAVGDGVKGVFLWGAQLEQASTVSEYVPTTTAAVTSNSTESLGLLVEEARTNSITNNTMVGAVAGTPGTNPTGWIYATTSSNGLTISIAGTGVENGINYIDYRFNGTTVASPNGCAIGFVNATAATGQTWTASTYWKLVGGSATGVTAWQLGLIENTAGGSFITGAFYSQTAPTSAALITQRPAATRTLSGGATVGLVTYPISIPVAGSTAIDFTLRIGLPQLEQGAFATSVIPTTTATVTRAADVASITGANFGTTRTNLVLRSEEFNDASWAKVGSTVTANTGTAPDGATTADLLTRTTTGVSYATQTFTKAASAIQYTFTVFAKQSVGNFCALRVQGTYPSRVDVVFNLSSATISTAAAVFGSFTGPSASITPYANGWYRLTVTATSDATTALQPVVSFNSNGAVVDGTDSVSTSAGLLWGAQLETGSTATAYIPTTTAAVSVFESSFYNQTEGSVFTNYRCFANTAYPDVFNISDGTNANRQQQFIDGSNGFTTFRELVSSTQQGIASQVSTINSEIKSVGAYSSIGLVFTLNGLNPSTNANVTHPTGLNKLSIGSSATGITNYFNGTIKRLTYWPTRLSNTTLQAITQP